MPTKGVTKGNVHFLTATEILAKDDLVEERVDFPEWGGSAMMRSLMGYERDAFEESIIETRGKSRIVNTRNFRAKLFSLSARGQDGNLLFTEEQVEALGRKNAAALERGYDVAARLSGLKEDDVEALTKALGEDQNGEPGTG